MKLSGFRIVLFAVGVAVIAGAVVLLIPRDRPVEVPAPTTAIETESGIVLSAVAIDFGEVEVSRSVRRTVILTNKGDRKILLRELGLEGPFSVAERVNLIPAGESRNLAVYFRPEQEGSTSGRLLMETIGDGEDIIEIALTGVGIVPAGEILAQADTNSTGGGTGEPGSSADWSDADSEDASWTAEPEPDEVDPEAGAGAGVISGDGFAATMIAGGIQAGGPQENKTGAQGGGGARPVKTRQFTSQQFASVFGYGPSALQQQAFDGSDAVLEDVFDQEVRPARFPRREPDFGEDEQSGGSKDTAQEEDSAGAVPRLVIAANSLLSVAGGGQVELPGQAQPLIAVDDGAGKQLALGGRLMFPQVPLPFDQVVDFEQWGEISGYVDPSGNMTLNLMLRVTDPNEMVIDVPMELTTGEAIGWATPETAVYLTGRPMDLATGLFELVGIQNVPPGLESAIQSKPIMLSVIGRVDNLF